MDWGRKPHFQPSLGDQDIRLVWVITFDLSGKGDPAGSYATAGVSLRIV
jgi:hypothetical protein